MRERVTSRPVFTVDAETFSWGDVVAAMRLSGGWWKVEQTTQHGLACAQRLAAAGEELDPHEAAAAEERFRYGRNLIAGEELEAWLERWELTLPEWRAYLRRALLRERCADELDETAARFPVSGAEVAAAVWADAVCSGLLEDAARRLAGDLALAAAAGQSLAGDLDAVVERAAAAAERAVAEAVTEEALERELAAHALDWVRVEGELLELPGEDLAREAALCIRDDGRALAEVAAECAAEPRRLGVYLDEIEPEVAAALLAASEGGLVGPLPRNGAFSLFLVTRKAPPGLGDPGVRGKAEERLVTRTVERAIASNVKWHEHL